MGVEQVFVTGITNEGKFITTMLEISEGTGTWQPWKEIDVEGEVNVGPLNSIDITGGILKSPLLCVTTVGGQLLVSSINRETAQWTAFQDLQTIIGGEWDKFQQVSIEQINENLHLCTLALAADTVPHILHTVRHQNGDWDQFQDVTQDGLAGSPGSFVAIDCAVGTTANELLHLCGVTNDGGLWHTSLSDQSQWSRFEDVKALSSNNPGAFTDVRIASTDNKLHVCAVLAGDLWHTIQFTNPIHWQDAFDNVKEGASDPGSIFSIGCTTEDTKLHLCVVTEDGKLWQTVRFEDPDGWIPFDDVTSIIGDTTVFLQIITLSAQNISLFAKSNCPPLVQQKMGDNCWRISRGDPHSHELHTRNQRLHAQNPACEMLC